MKKTLEEAQQRRLVTRILLTTAVCWAGLCATPARADIVYSGPLNIQLQGTPDAGQVFDLFVAGDPGSWDTLAFYIDNRYEGAGLNNMIPGISEVALATSLADLPIVTRFQYGDAFPSDAVFGSGSEILWGVGTGPADGDFYAEMQIPATNTQPQEEGWIHLNISNSATPTPTITVEGWAYAIGDAISSMGQISSSTVSSGGGTPVPEIDPSSGMTALTLLSGALLVIRSRQHRRR